MIDVRWQDKAFVSTGDGVGYNLVHQRGLQHSAIDSPIVERASSHAISIDYQF